MSKRYFVSAVAGVVLMCGGASAEPLKIEAVMTPKEKIQLDFSDGSKHFVLMVRREGEAKGTGVLAGAKVVEYGMHDIVPGVGGDPRGYLALTTASGDIAYVKWRVRAIFVTGSDGKPELLDNGYWEIAGGTGALAKAKGAGVLHIKGVSPTDRKFILDGNITVTN